MSKLRVLFVLILLLAGTTFLWRIWNILPLYTNTNIRSSTQSTLETITKREGWLMSNVSVTAVARERLTIMYRDHHRGRDPETCYTVTMPDASLHPCE